MQLKNSIAGSLFRCLLFLSIILLACHGLQPTVAAQDRIPLLEGGPHDGSWESTDVSLEYQYVVRQSKFKLNIGGKAKRGFDQVTIWIKFFDENDKVLKTETVFFSGFRQRLFRGKDSIEKTFEIPTGSTQFVFQSMLKIREGL